MARDIAVLKIAHAREPWQKLKPRSEVLDKKYDRAPLEEALKTSSYTTGVVKKFFGGKGFGFIEIEGKDCFFHKGSIRIRDRLAPSSKVVKGHSRSSARRAKDQCFGR